MSEARVGHAWNDPDGDGHDCVDCSPMSVWKCDEAAHLRPEVDHLAGVVKARLRGALLAFSRAHRTSTPSNRGLR